MLKRDQNHWVLIGAILGIALGFLLRSVANTSPLVAPCLSTLNIIGLIFINLLKMLLIPLIFLSIVLGIAQLRNQNHMKKIWPATLIFYTLSLCAAITVGLLMSNIFKPGHGLTLTMFSEHTDKFTLNTPHADQVVVSMINNFLMNPIQAAANNQIFPIVIFAFLIGIALVINKTNHQRTLEVMDECMSLVMLILSWVIKLAPVGIMALLAQMIATQDSQLFSVLGKYMIVVSAATLIHGLIVLPLALWLITGMTPWHFFNGMKEALITALSTSSSAATMPVTLRCLTEKLNIHPSVTGFVIPLGTTVNMDGTALYEAMAALFVANLCGIELTIIQQLMVAISAMIASIGAPGIPSAGMVTLAMVLQSVGLPIEALAILIPIDKPLDTIRTAVNVEGDAVGACIVQKITRV